MTERTAFEPGVPCWVDTWQPDATTAAAFYAALMGWETAVGTPDAPAARYVMCRRDGRDVAAIGEGAGAAPGAGAPTWTTYVHVARVDEAVARARAAGGQVVAGPADSLDGGRIAILRDPVGAVLGVWEPGAHGGAQLVNAPGAWSMSVLLTDDPDAAKPFYEATFGWNGDPFSIGDAEATLFRLEGYVGGLPGQPVPRDVIGVMAPAFGRPAGWVVGFWVDDADATAARAAELGGTVLAGPFDSPISRDAVIADPAGAVFTVTTVPSAAR